MVRGFIRKSQVATGLEERSAHYILRATFGHSLYL